MFLILSTHLTNIKITESVNFHSVQILVKNRKEQCIVLKIHVPIGAVKLTHWFLFELDSVQNYMLIIHHNCIEWTCRDESNTSPWMALIYTVCKSRTFFKTSKIINATKNLFWVIWDIKPKRLQKNVTISEVCMPGRKIKSHLQ